MSRRLATVAACVCLAVPVVTRAQFVTHSRTPSSGSVVLPPLPAAAVRPPPPVPARPVAEPDPELTEEEETFPRQPDAHMGPVTVDGDADPRPATWNNAVPALGICLDRARGLVAGIEATLVLRVTMLPGGQVESAVVVGEPAVLRRVGYRVMSSAHVAEAVVDALVDCSTVAVRAVPVRVARRAIFTIPVTLATRPMSDREHTAAAAERDRRDTIQRRQDRADTARANADTARANADEARANAEASRPSANTSEDETPTVCTNTCRTANDNECDDGGPQSLYSICAYGSDCDDCGERPVRSHHRRRH